jgi:hypothetical protein
MDPFTSAAVDLLFEWLSSHTGHEYRLAAERDGLRASDGQRSIALRVAPLFAEGSDPEWARRCQAVARQFEKLTQASFALWVPPEADIPHGDRTDFLQRVVQVVDALQPGERGQVEFPVTLTLKKSGTEASYVQVVGGLAQHWARLTGRAYGQYVLDTTAIHRLPEPESRVADLLEWVALLGNGMKPGASSEITAEDAWTVRRSISRHAPVLIGAPPGSDPSNGTIVRRLLRDALRVAAAAPAEADVARVLVLVGDFRTMAEENATIALHSADPALYAGLDLILLEADGQTKALLGPRAGRL